MHRTVRWCTGQGLVCQADSGELAALGNKLTAYDYNSPDCPVCTGLSGEPTVGRPTVDRGICARHVAGPTVGRGHRTVRCAPDMSGAPTAPKCQRSASPNKEGDLHRTVSGGAPDCPVRQAAEGKNCLLEMLSTAPSCLGAIKGTPRRMEENTKQP